MGANKALLVAQQDHDLKDEKIFMSEMYSMKSYNDLSSDIKGSYQFHVLISLTEDVYSTQIMFMFTFCVLV